MSEASRIYRAWRDHRAPLFGYLVHRLPEREEAEDILQESMLRLVRRIEGIAEGKERAWLFATARNLLADRGRERAHVFQNNGTGEGSPHGTMEDHADTRIPDFLETLIARESHECLRRQFLSLEPAMAELLEMKYLGGLSDQDLAEVLKLSPGHVRVRLHRGRNALESLYRRNCEGRMET